MIHSLAGGKLGEEKFVNIAKLEFECLKDQYFWYFSEFDLNVGDSVLAPFGRVNQLQKATVVRFDKNVNSKMIPFNKRNMKFVFKKIE